MKREDRQRRIHDYLDGRLAPAERESFEADLREDPELARRVAILAEVGEALREEPGALPPGFYTRLGARFEAAREPRRWFHPLSWETAGLVAAVALAAVLFVPGLIQRDIGDLPGAAPATRDMPSALPERSDPSGRRQRADDESRIERDPAGETEGFVDELESQLRENVAVERAESGFEPSEPAAEPRPEDSRQQQAPESKQQGSFAPAPPPGPERESPAIADVGFAERADATAGDKDDAGVEAEEDKAELRKRARASGLARSFVAAKAGDTRLEGSPLEEGVVEAGLLRIVELPPTEEAERREQAVRELAQVSVAPVRAVLVGPRAVPLDCAAAHLRLTSDGYEILLAPGDAPNGCRFRLPDDGRPVRVVDP